MLILKKWGEKEIKPNLKNKVSAGKWNSMCRLADKWTRNQLTVDINLFTLPFGRFPFRESQLFN